MALAVQVYLESVMLVTSNSTLATTLDVYVFSRIIDYKDCK